MTPNRDERRGGPDCPKPSCKSRRQRGGRRRRLRTRVGGSGNGSLNGCPVRGLVSGGRRMVGGRGGERGGEGVVPHLGRGSTNELPPRKSTRRYMCLATCVLWPLCWAGCASTGTSGMGGLVDRRRPSHPSLTMEFLRSLAIEHWPNAMAHETPCIALAPRL